MESVVKGQRVKFRDDFSRHVRGIVWLVDSEPQTGWFGDPRAAVWLVSDDSKRYTRTAWVEDLRAVE